MIGPLAGRGGNGHSSFGRCLAQCSCPPYYGVNGLEHSCCVVAVSRAAAGAERRSTALFYRPTRRWFKLIFVDMDVWKRLFYCSLIRVRSTQTLIYRDAALARSLVLAFCVFTLYLPGTSGHVSVLWGWCVATISYALLIRLCAMADTCHMTRVWRYLELSYQSKLLFQM